MKQTRLNICHIINGFNAGGAQVFLSSLTKYQSLTNNVFILSISKIDEISGFDYSLRKKIESNNIYVIDLERKPGKNFTFVKSLKIAKTFFKNNRIDIINTHLPLSHLFTSILGLKIPIVNTIHNAPEKTSFLTKFLNRNSAKIYCSKSALMLNNFKGKNTVINNGVEFNGTNFQNHQIDLIKDLNIPLGSKVVISVGALRKQKNYSFLMDLARKFPENSNIHFVVCGGFDKDLKLFESVKNNKSSNFHYIGTKSNINNYLSSADLFLSCSVHEGLPIAVLEAFITGIPVLLSPIEQHMSISEGVYKSYIPADFKLESFKKSIISIIENNETHNSILNKRKDHIIRFSIVDTSKQYLKFYKEIINKQIDI